MSDAILESKKGGVRFNSSWVVIERPDADVPRHTREAATRRLCGAERGRAVSMTSSLCPGAAQARAPLRKASASRLHAICLGD